MTDSSVHLLPPASALHSKKSSYLRWVGVTVVGQDFYSSSVCKNVCSPHGLLTTQNSAFWITGNLSDSPQICSTLPELLCSPRVALEIKITYSWISTLLYLSLITIFQILFCQIVSLLLFEGSCYLMFLLTLLNLGDGDFGCMTFAISFSLFD